MTELLIPTEADAVIPPDPRRFEYVRAGDLVIDHRVQRPTTDDRVARIQREFDWKLFEVVTAFRRDGKLVVDEGQHRTLAVQGVDPDVLVPVMIVPGEFTNAAAAKLQLDILTGRRPHELIDRWELWLHEGQSHVVAATKVLERHGLEVGRQASTRRIEAIGAINKIVRRDKVDAEYGSKLLDDTITVIRRAFPDADREVNVQRWNGKLLAAVADVLHYNQDVDLDLERLADNLGDRSTNWYLTDAKQKSGGGIRERDVIYNQMLADYNRGLSQARRLH